MTRIMRYRSLMVGAMVGLSGLTLLPACSSASDENTGGEEGLKEVRALFNFSLPIKRTKPATRMSGDVVQSSGTDDQFNGIADVRLLCFGETPTESSTNLGNMIEMKTSGSDVATDVTTNDYSMCQEISIPVGTSYFGFYAHTADVARNHEECMKYGTIETVGLDKGSYSDNSAVRFRPVQLCTSTEPFGGSTAGQRLFTLLNDLMSTTAVAAAPNDRWDTVENMFLNEAYQRMKQLTTLSSYNVQTWLAFVNRVVNLEGPDDQGKELAAAITAKIAACCKEAPTPTSETISLKDEYMGFPTDIHLPDGAARIKWNDDIKMYVEVRAQDYGKDLAVASINDYVYPMNLQYQVFSDILASEQMVLQLDGGTTGSEFDDWNTLIEEGYAGAASTVQQSTQSVAMVKQVEYAVGQLAVRAELSATTLPDADGRSVDASKGFTLKGYLVGGQREVDYNFQPVAGSKQYAIYDTALNGGSEKVRSGYSTTTDYILGLGTERDEPIKIALELVNDGDNFQGTDGTIAHGATFYLVASLKPTDGGNYHAENRNHVFDRDHATLVNLTITSLASATYGLPDLNLPIPTTGISVNLSWSGGISFNEEL